VGLLEQVQMYLDKESFNGPKDWGVPGRLQKIFGERFGYLDLFPYIKV